ncbi:MAG: hypothetical protein GTO63_16880 [Anaerolineae bacterium]|nr:hypothetical protein [Anaerolineae bacterium]NIN96473.1 hypothetical protein [Anaerolineae bacterium]NIQ81118.1 hypothetical protein [Anaerolineae bacterium]
MYSDSASKCLQIIADQDVDWGWKAWCKIFVGHCYLKMEDYDSAREAFQSVISLYPGTDFAEASQGVLDLMSRGLRSEG